MSEPGALQNYINCEVSFGEVPVGTTVVKTYVIKNHHNETVNYFVTRNTTTNPIYYVFDVNKYEAKVETGAEFVLKISYTPNIPGSKNFDYFSIVDSRRNFYRLCFRGECIGPSLNCSIRQLNFFHTPKHKIIKQVFDLTNNSRVPAIFQFDCGEEEQGVFVVAPRNGTIRPQQHQYITVKFLPQTPRFYAKQLCCLVLYYEPILLNLFGIFSTEIDYDPEVPFRYYPFPYEETVGFQGYLSDSVTLKHVPPPVSLSVNYLDFGQIMPESSCQTMTTSFTNHLENEVEVEWENAALFRIYPEKLEIPPKQSALYEIRFKPDSTCRLLSAILNGHVSWTLSDNEFPSSLNVPIPITLRLIGHSFPKNQSWIPSISIVPNTVILPLTLPNFPSWTMFMIQSHGHLPVLFKLLPPKKTNFVMKPMVGLVRTFQIIVVQLQNSSNETNSYIETWSIELNGQVERLTPIYVKAQTDVPRVLIAANNVIQFEPMQPGTQANTYVPIRNISFCHLQYEFQETEKFGVDSSKGKLAPNEEIFVTCWYTSDLDEVGEHSMEVICEVQYLFSEEGVMGETVDIVVTVLTHTIYSELCALPQIYECGEVECGTVVKTSFYLFNFCQSNINFKLCHDHNLEDVKLRPVCGRCGPREKMLVCVQFTINTLGKRTLFIAYNTRLNQYSEDTTAEGAKNIFRIEYHCIYATLQILDLVEHNFGYLMSNDDLWAFFRIDEINAALIETNQGEIRRVNLWVPDSEVSDKLFYVIFSIKNVSSIYTRLVLKRRQVCDCKLKETNDSFTFRHKVFDCPHKDMLTMEIGSPSLPADSIQSLVFKIKYLLPDENTLSYVLNLSNERTIILNIYIYGVPADSYVLSVFDHNYRLNLGYVYIGLKEPPVQAYWLYNNTTQAVPYKLDELEIIKLCNDDGFTVLKCLNSMGFLKPHSAAPILFKFWPIEVKTYKVSVSLTLGVKEVTLEIEGYGTCEKNKRKFEDLMSLPVKPLKNKMMSLSVDRLMIEPIPVASFADRMFFIKNRSKTQELKYSWKPCFVDGLVKIEPLNEEGFLKPSESQSVFIKIASVSEPCSIKVLLCCKFIDYKQLVLHEQSVALYQKRRRSSTSEFVISDGEKLDKDDKLDDYVIEPMPEFLYIALPITVNVIGALDRDNCVCVEDQMKQRPCEGIQIDVDSFVKNYFQKAKVRERPIRPVRKKKKQKSEVQPATKESEIQKEMTQSVLELLVGDAIFSDYFRETVKNLNKEPSPFYSQIKLSQAKRQKQQEKETKRFLTQPTLPEVADICKEAAIDSLHFSFQLGPVPKNENEKS